MRETIIATAIAVCLFTGMMIMDRAYDRSRPEPEISATSTIQVRDEAAFVLTPTMVDEYEDWIQYVEIMEGDMIYIRVTKPVYPDPGNNQSSP